jgi:hypothetical protein
VGRKRQSHFKLGGTGDAGESTFNSMESCVTLGKHFSLGQGKLGKGQWTADRVAALALDDGQNVCTVGAAVEVRNMLTAAGAKEHEAGLVAGEDGTGDHVPEGVSSHNGSSTWINNVDGSAGDRHHDWAAISERCQDFAGEEFGALSCGGCMQSLDFTEKESAAVELQQREDVNAR